MPPFNPSLNLFTNSFGQGVNIGDHFQRKSQLRELAKVAQGGLGNQDVANQAGSILMRLGDVGSGIRAQNIPYNQEQQRLQREFQNQQSEF